ncbi:mitochondrial carrier domain-containing protein [Chytridium lagenaria]|nr:mitochondrial carrier domain-containing protein [Chytridium lagenaria]
MAIDTTPVDPNAPLAKKPISFINLAIGAGLNVFEVTTLGQPFEVIKTQMAANRSQTIPTSIKTIWSRGGVFGFYQGLIPWAWIEAGTKGAVLMFAASEIEYGVRVMGGGPALSGIIGGMGAYTTMGFCTFMKTVEVTRHKGGDAVAKSTIQVAREIFAKEGIAGINKGVNAVAVRQCTNWGSRFGLSRIAEDNQSLSGLEKVVASSIGGGLSCWNQPIEVIRVEMQSQVKAAGRPEKMTIGSAAGYIYKNNGLIGFYRGVTPRIGLGMWQTICMVAFGDSVKAYFAKK